jgi:hypothetical protein
MRYRMIPWSRPSAIRTPFRRARLKSLCRCHPAPNGDAARFEAR